MEELKIWLFQNKIDFSQDGNILVIDGLGECLFVQHKEGKIFDDSLGLLLDPEEMEVLDSVKNVIYSFGGKFYYLAKEDFNNIKFNLLRYVGKSTKEFDTESFLGVHGKYELLNGSREYEDWIKKAKFLGVKNLGICEKNTMAGMMTFQLTCLKKDINPVLGVTISVKLGSETGSNDLKFYIKNESGWDNILSIYKEVSIINQGYIFEKDLFQYAEDLICIIDPKSFEFDKLRIKKYKSKFQDIYYQLDTVEYTSDERDRDYLLNLKKFINSDILEPVLINDAYYLDKEDSYIKGILNTISSKREWGSDNQYFKDLDDNFSLLETLFKDERLYDVFMLAVSNIQQIVDKAKFRIETSKRFLPKYIMNPDEAEQFQDNEELFWHLIEKGLSKCPQDKLDIYMDRIEYEYDVVKNGDVIDYFLILADVIRYCKENKILVGHARGSAAGSLISYVLDITQVDPIEWNLLFERFLNKGRILKSLPDIDIDVQPSKKDQVKNYLKDKYGENSFCYIGTYTSLQLKGCIKELAKMYNVDFSKANYITSILDLEEETWDELFKNAAQKPQLKNFIQEYPEMFNDIPLMLGSFKAQSIHACATLLTPSEKDIHHWIPLHHGEKEGEKILVSDWEGEDLADSGFLKEDILVIDQLDKFRYCLDLIKETVGDEIDIYNVPLDEEGVLELFRNGNNSDIFQFGSRGLTQYCKELKPSNIDELIDATALYRPGAMESNFHNEYILRKFGEREIKYRYGLEKVTESTKGLIVYQEQTMEACRVLGGFSLMDADDIRKAIVKKRDSIIQGYKDQFLKGALANGCPEEEAKEIWHELEVHGSYSFNRSHAAAYTLISYVGQWLKYHYPIQFWTTTLQFAKEEDIPPYISEISKLESIKIIPPDINYSGREFHTEYQKGEIYWSLAKIKWCGDVAVDAIIAERENNGNFFSFSEFMNRVEKKKVNKRIVINLILSGAFDDIENIEEEKDRIKVINQYYKLTGSKRDSEDEFLVSDKLDKNYWWILKQKELTGYGNINYRSVLKQSNFKHHIPKYIESFDLFNENTQEKEVVVGGIIQKVIERTNKKGTFCQVEIESNNETVYLTVWSEQYADFKSKFDNSEGKIIFIKGTCKFDPFKKTQVIHTNEDSEIEILD